MRTRTRLAIDDDFTEAELNELISAARKGRYGHRDATLILIMARHGLRVSEAVDLEWSQIDFTRAHLHVRRCVWQAIAWPQVKSVTPMRIVCVRHSYRR